MRSTICEVSTIERALAEEMRQRIGQLIIAHLEDALIDREDAMRAGRSVL